VEFTTHRLEQLALRRRLVFSRHLLAQVVAALRSGKHLMLTGPPGTGKTSLAYLTAELARSAILSTGCLAVTACSDWGLAETIGHYADSPDGPVFKAGVFLQAIHTGQWLVIDELNRADLDRAFGPLFTVLANQPVILPYTQAGHTHPIAIVPATATAPPDTDQIRVPGSWRIIATMNEFDKATLHRLSYALMRRFACIEVESPPDDVLRSLITGAGSVVTDLLVIRRFVDLGPALFLDAANYAEERALEGEATRSRVVFEAFYSYFLPQLDDLDSQRARGLFEALLPFFDPPEVTSLRRAIRKVLGGREGALPPVVSPAEQTQSVGPPYVGEDHRTRRDFVPSS
jgi:DNA polymerase III delta prime subunit